jgi:hypothetical protein
MDPFDDILQRAASYAHRRGIVLEDRLGFGLDGAVFSTSRSTALKIHRRRERFSRELDCYKRLHELGVHEVRGHAVPRLVDSDDSLLAIEMTIVVRPFLLDFAGAYLDAAPEFPEDVVQQWLEEKREQFGPDLPAAAAVLSMLRSRYGIHMLDVHPGNAAFRKAGD